MMSGARAKAELEQHHASSFGWAMVCAGRDRLEAEELLQVVYVKVLEGSACFAGDASFKTWLFGVIRRTAAERRRRARLRRFALTRFAMGIPGEAPRSPEAAAGADEERTRLARALTNLSTRQREVLHLVFYEDLTIERAAIVMGISTGSARTHYARGKSRLRDRLRDPERS